MTFTCHTGDKPLLQLASTVLPKTLVAPRGSSEIVRAPAMLGTSFETIGGLTAASDAVVLGTVASIKYAPVHNLPGTIVWLRVEQALKGSVKQGEELVISEPGGLHAGPSKVDPGEYGEPREVAIEGVPVMKPYERWLLFLLYNDQCQPVAETCWVVKNVYEGKFLVGGDDRIVFTGNPADLDSDESLSWFNVHKQNAGRTVTGVLAEIDAALKP